MVNLRKHEPYDEMSFCDWNIKCKTTVLIKENEMNFYNYHQSARIFTNGTYENEQWSFYR